ncbi:FimV/HubP family polar landmark protein [Oleiagrimonas sp. C23AA]|uniref:FimV/HubP family polar landmark protein n=1 Tax=Oleiagrimonas sp. C23AA TaxID=2719047 RepID=UPI00142255E4|nr:FimV/HubP family polar landmark protein [Oleiagrimonas sp. C23AA]NII10123.1 fimbrial protein FimV [Oleiagrimonas sp. C23AA]
MNRTLKLSVLTALALGCSQAMALGLGQIHVKSKLGKPLLAEIPLVADYPGEANDVQAQLASQDAFKRANLDFNEVSGELKFAVVGDGHGGKLIRITSDAPINEPFLDFLVEVDWPKGRLVREFTVLLDPPTMAPAAPHRSAPAPAPSRRAPAPVPVRHRAPPSQGASGHVHDGRYGPVHDGQTLTSVARQTLPADVSLSQMMLALYKENPDAFYKDNINALKRGAVLRVPSKAQAEALSEAAAIAEVRQQNAAWRGGSVPKPTTVGGAGGRDQRATSGAQADSGDGDHLQLVPPKQGGGANTRAGVKGGTGDQAVNGLRDQLARTKESLSTAQQQSQDLQSQVNSLQNINDKNQKLIDLKNAQIAELQQKLAQARKQAGLPPAPQAAPSPAVQPDTTPAAAGSVASASAKASQPATGSTAMTPASAHSAPAASAMTPPAKPAAHTPAHAAKPAPTHHATAPHHPASAQPWYTALWVKALAALVIIGGLLAVLLGMRKRQSSAPIAPTTSLADQFADEEAPPSMDDEQRELLDQLAEHPDDVGLHLELVSLYYARGDVEHFEGAAEAMYAHIADTEQPEWLDVVAMGRELSPGHPLFADPDAAPVDDAAEPPVDDSGFSAQAYEAGAVASPFAADQALDIEHDESELVMSTPGDHPQPRADDDGYDFDFALPPQDEDGTGEKTSSFNAEPDLHGEGGDDLIMPPLADDQAPAPADEVDAQVPPAEVSEAEAEEDVTDFSWLPPAEDDNAPQASAEDAGPADLPPLEPDFDLGTDLPETPAADAASDESQQEPMAFDGTPDDPVDTKLDLARAYMDMGDPEGARAMLEEVLEEGSQMQKDMAQKLLDDLP